MGTMTAVGPGTRMRHGRSREFDKALVGSDSADIDRWTDLASDPISATAIAHRAAVLRAAWRPAVRDRIGFLERRCVGKKVLDVGCVAHDVERMESATWLHGRLSRVAAECIGVDVLVSGVREMQARGFDAVVHDLREGLGPLEPRAPFDVIVAGELIEHVESLDMLFRVAGVALSAGGTLILTTPNPYAPHRVRAGQRGVVWENVDHIIYAFPSGIAELAERHGLVLAEAAVTDERRERTVRSRVKDIWRMLQGRHWVSVGFSTDDGSELRVRRVGDLAVIRWLRRTLLPHRRFVGETFIYVITRPDVARRPA